MAFSVTGSADPQWRYRQLERMGNTAILMMQAAEQRRARELERLDRRVQLATQAIAAGGELADPAIRSVLDDMRALDAKRRYRQEGLGKHADMLESSWQAASMGPEAVAQRAQQSVMDEYYDIQRSMTPLGGGVPGPVMPQQNPLAIHRQAVQRSPLGGDYVASMAQRSPSATRALFEEPEPEKPTEATLEERERAFNIAELDSGDPRRVEAAQRALGSMPRARHPLAGRAGRAPKAPPTPAEEMKDIGEGVAKRAAELYKERVQAWDDEMRLDSAGRQGTLSAEEKQARMDRRPQPPVGVGLASAKVRQLRKMLPPESEDLAAYEELLAQAAAHGKVAETWAYIQKELARAGGQ